ncbi:MAG TPA: hypothetical protein VGJ44_22730 [Kribbellaceae bacterium]
MPLVDLDDPVELRARWAALAAVSHASGRDRIWWADERGWHHEDPRGNDLRLIAFPDGRAVIFGYHAEDSRTAQAGALADLLSGAPEWIGQPEVRHRIVTGQLGFVYGHFSGTWARASYPGDPWQPLEDGFTSIASWLTDDSETEYELAEQLLTWAGPELNADQLRFGAMGLVRAAGTTGISVVDLDDFFGLLGPSISRLRPDGRPPDLEAGLAAAAAFGGPVAPAPRTVAAGAPTQPVPAEPAGPAPAPVEAEVEEPDDEMPAALSELFGPADDEIEEEARYGSEPVGPARPPYGSEPYDPRLHGPHPQTAPQTEHTPQPEPAPQPARPQAPAAYTQPPYGSQPYGSQPIAPQPAGPQPPGPQRHDVQPAASSQPAVPAEPAKTPPAEPAAAPAPAAAATEGPTAGPAAGPQAPAIGDRTGTDLAATIRGVQPADGTTPGRAPEQPAPVPAREFDSLEEAMRAEPERRRPRPENAAAFDVLYDWCRARTRIVPSGFTIHVYVASPSAIGYSFDLDPPKVPDAELDSHQIGGLLHALWRDEADPEHGGWMFARIDAAGRTVRIDRWYDSIPSWWEGPIADRPVDAKDVAWHLQQRAAQWRPSYAGRLELADAARPDGQASQPG